MDKKAATGLMAMLNGEIIGPEQFLVSEIKVIDLYMATDDTGSKRSSHMGQPSSIFLHFTLGTHLLKPISHPALVAAEEAGKMNYSMKKNFQFCHRGILCQG